MARGGDHRDQLNPILSGDAAPAKPDRRIRIRPIVRKRPILRGIRKSPLRRILWVRPHPYRYSQPYMFGATPCDFVLWGWANPTLTGLQTLWGRRMKVILGRKLRGSSKP